MGKGVLLVNDGYGNKKRSCTKNSEGRLVLIVSVLFLFHLKKGGRGQEMTKGMSCIREA